MHSYINTSCILSLYTKFKCLEKYLLLGIMNLPKKSSCKPKKKQFQIIFSSLNESGGKKPFFNISCWILQRRFLQSKNSKITKKNT